MKTLTVNMKQFDKNFKVYSDNIVVFEIIKSTNGKFNTDNPERFTNWLNEFNIFYTLKGVLNKTKEATNELPEM